MTARQIKAAGGVVVREGPNGSEIAVVHRRRYDDWSLPKGKLDPGEKFKQAALREVEEETGLRCELGPELTESSYTAKGGARKRVRWWRMTPVACKLGPHNEIDDARWVTPKEAAKLLDYKTDRRLVKEALVARGSGEGGQG